MTYQLLSHHGLRESNAGARHPRLVGGVTEKLGLRSLKDALWRKASGRVLELTAGTGPRLARYPVGCEVIAVDLDRSDLLAFEDETFDVVTSSLSLCRFANLPVLLREMSRVCKPHGRILVVEHGHCQPERDPVDLMRRAGLQVVDVQSTFFGTAHVIEAMAATRN
jgi:SAM-dependent methyltransferase